jgi:hypothetical protein
MRFNLWEMLGLLGGSSAGGHQPPPPPFQTRGMAFFRTRRWPRQWEHIWYILVYSVISPELAGRRNQVVEVGNGTSMFPSFNDIKTIRQQ